MHPHSKGFTLLEVLLALTILAVIMTAIYGSFATSGRNVESAEAVRDGTDRARTLIALLSNDIANAYVNAGVAGTFLFGKKNVTDDEKVRIDSLSLTTLTNWRKPDSREMDLWEVGYSFQDKPDGSGRVLMRREKRELAAGVAPLEGGVELEITDSIEALQFRYSSGARWEDEWDTRKVGRAPRAVEIVLTLDDGRVYATQVDVRYQ